MPSRLFAAVEVDGEARMGRIAFSILQTGISKHSWLRLSSTVADTENPHRRSYGQEISSAQVGWAHSSVPSSVVRWALSQKLEILGSRGLVDLAAPRRAWYSYVGGHICSRAT